MELAASTVCNVLSGPGDVLRALISGAVESPVLALSFLLLLGVFLGFLVFITSFEILELVPILSFVLDWIEFCLWVLADLYWFYLGWSLSVSHTA